MFLAYQDDDISFIGDARVLAVTETHALVQPTQLVKAPWDRSKMIRVDFHHPVVVHSSRLV